MGVHVPQGEGAVSGVVSGIFGIFVQYFIMATYGYTDILIDDRLVCEKLTIFPYAKYIVEFCVWLAFLWYSQVQDWSGGWRKIYVQKRNTTHATWPLPQQQQLAAAGGHFSSGTVDTCRVSRNKIAHLKVSPGRITWRKRVMLFYPPRSDALFSNYFEDLFKTRSCDSTTAVAYFQTSWYWRKTPF